MDKRVKSINIDRKDKKVLFYMLRSVIWQRKILPGQFVLFLSSLFSKYRRRNKKRFAFFYRNTMGDRINVLLQILSNDREKFSILLFVSRTILQVIHHQWCLFSDRRHEYILAFCKIRHLWSKLNTNQNSFFQMPNVPLIKTYIIVSDFLRRYLCSTKFWYLLTRIQLIVF